MTSDIDEQASDIPSCLEVVMSTILCGINAIGVAAYMASLPFLVTNALLQLFIVLITIVGLIPFFGRIFCPWINIGFGVILFTPMLGGIAYAYPNWFTIGITMFMAILSTLFWSLSCIGVSQSR